METGIAERRNHHDSRAGRSRVKAEAAERVKAVAKRIAKESPKLADLWLRTWSGWPGWWWLETCATSSKRAAQLEKIRPCWRARDVPEEGQSEQGASRRSVPTERPSKGWRHACSSKAITTGVDPGAC